MRAGSRSTVPSMAGGDAVIAGHHPPHGLGIVRRRAADQLVGEQSFERRDDLAQLHVGGAELLERSPESGRQPRPRVLGAAVAHVVAAGDGRVVDRSDFVHHEQLAAFRLGASHGYRMFECDVKLSADGVPFLLHDSTLERTTSGNGIAGEQTWDALSQLDAGSWHSRNFAGEPLPTLTNIANSA